MWPELAAGACIFLVGFVCGWLFRWAGQGR